MTTESTPSNDLRPLLPSGEPGLAEPAPWLTRHASMTITRWTNGWVACTNLWRHDIKLSEPVRDADAMMTVTVHWPQLSPLSRADLVSMMWQSPLRQACQLAGSRAGGGQLPGTERGPGEIRWTKVTAHLVGTSRETSLLAYLTGTPPGSRKITEVRVGRYASPTVPPVNAIAFLSSFSLMLRQHSA